MIHKPNPDEQPAQTGSGAAPKGPMRALPGGRREAHDRADEILSEREVQTLIASCSQRAPTGVRNRALISLIYCSGLRISEVLNLIPDDVDLEAGTVRVRHRSEDRRRTVRLFEAAHAFVEAWFVRRHALCLPSDGPLFCTLQGEPLKDAYIRAMLPRTARRAGVEKRVHALGLRNSFASRLHDEGATLEAIRRQLGHADLGSTLACLATPNSNGRVKDIDQIPWSLSPPERKQAPRPFPTQNGSPTLPPIQLRKL